ncbi:dethiobiotin synthase [Bacillus sp. FJAT-44742]|uniref:dethiobiotin synthase n=1 Tax=Bacillus sp. FJAT-44742 TaxID=2014005 RepID=UPI0012FF0A2E|nr:dethiobiotin synthase [Bacillus sp. FJAT-44742]
MNGFFVTGTDTEVGKTIVTCLLYQLLRERGFNVVPFKPIQTGTISQDGGHSLAPDVEMYKKSGVREASSNLSAYLFEPPCSPHLASRLAGTTIDFPVIFETMRHLSRKYNSILMEGAGGLSVPINEQKDMADLAKEAGLPLLIVARPNLGTINHTLQTISYAKSKGLTIAGVIFSNVPAEKTFIEEENIRYIQQFAPVLGSIPEVREIEEKIGSADLLATLAPFIETEKLVNILRGENNWLTQTN